MKSRSSAPYGNKDKSTKNPVRVEQQNVSELGENINLLNRCDYLNAKKKMAYDNSLAIVPLI